MIAHVYLCGPLHYELALFMMAHVSFERRRTRARARRDTGAIAKVEARQSKTPHSKDWGSV